MIEQVNEYMENTDSIMNETDILHCVARKLGIAEKLAYYDGISNEVFENIIENTNIKNLDYSNNDTMTPKY